MNLDAVLSAVKKSFIIRKSVDFKEAGLHFELEPLTAIEEVKIMESLKGIDASLYFTTLKKRSIATSIKLITLKDGEEVSTVDLSKELIEYTDEEGKAKTKSKFLYVLDYIEKWPESMIDVLFEAHANMHQEVEDRIRKQTRFEIFKVSEKPAEDKEPTLREVPKVEDDEAIDEDLTEVEKLNLKVKEELEQADQKIAEREIKGVK